MKQGILVVSFGTSYPDALQREIVPVEWALGAAFPEHRLYRAFSSGIIRKKLLEMQALPVFSPEEALAAMVEDGVEDGLVQPTYLIHGAEHERLVETVRRAAPRFRRLALGRPVLSLQSDYEALAEGLMGSLPVPGAGEALVLMGHGTAHHGNPSYPAMEYVLHAKGYKNVFLGTVEGYPTIQEVCDRLREYGGISRVLLAPMMIVAGDHARNDLAQDWCAVLSEAGFHPEPILTGLGAYPAVQQLLIRHAMEGEVL